ncbi:MAG: hypothetical protein DCF32_22535 [Leptolyngbya sp.]|nr:MAG: hypothetical protein DCF32_22535 [Leptolyngbya sp.]
MKPRSERQQDFEAIKQNLFTAGVATVKAAQAQEDMFMTTLEALSEAYEDTGIHQLAPGETEPESDLTPILETLLTQRQDALNRQDYEAYVEAEEKLQRLDELAVARLERQVRLLKAQQELTIFADKPQPPEAFSDRKVWTEAALKKEYKTLADLQSALGINARTWRQAVEQANGLT